MFEILEHLPYIDFLQEYIGNVTEDNSVDDLAERLSDTGLEDEKVTEKLDEEAVQNRLQE